MFGLWPIHGCSGTNTRCWGSKNDGWLSTEFSTIDARLDGMSMSLHRYMSYYIFQSNQYILTRLMIVGDAIEPYKFSGAGSIYHHINMHSSVSIWLYLTRPKFVLMITFIVEDGISSRCCCWPSIVLIITPGNDGYKIRVPAAGPDFGGSTAVYRIKWMLLYIIDYFWHTGGTGKTSKGCARTACEGYGNV